MVDPAPSPLESCRVTPDELRWRCDPARLPFRTTADLEDGGIAIIGQPRAVEAIRLGLDIRAEGYNIFVAGDVGTGRSTTVRRQLAALDPGERTPEDLVYVHNFDDPDRPRLLAFQAGQGRAFRDAIDELLRSLLAAIPGLFESDAYRTRRQAILEQATGKHKGRLKEFEDRVRAEGFALVQIQLGEVVRPDVVPLIDGKPVSLDDLESRAAQNDFDPVRLGQLRETYARLEADLAELAKRLRASQRNLRKKLAGLDRDLAQRPIRDAVDDLADEFRSDAAREHLGRIADDLLDHLEGFRLAAEHAAAADEGSAASDADAAREATAGLLERYAVNLFVDNTGQKGRPVLWESAPTYRNLFGIVEPSRDGEEPVPAGHARIKPGSLVRANGGFLVVDAIDLLVEPGVWPALKRALRTHELKIPTFDPRGTTTFAVLQPEPVPLDVKVILIGTRQIHRALFALDEDFNKIFKIKAEFTVETDLSDEELDNYARFVRKKTEDDALPPLTAAAVGAVVEHAVRLAGRRGRITTRFNLVADVVRESAYWARRAGAEVVDAAHVEQALDRRRHRLDLLEDHSRRQIAEGARIVDLAAEVVGQVNGLLYLDVGDYAFGQPARITAVTAMGRSGIVDIERESELAGPVHTKGVLILAGFLRDRFARDKPLSLAASLCFEQNYMPVDGDSASCAELCALLSSLADVPIRQGIAVTGSVNQKGEVQPIGGINEKIEGFFDVCRAVGREGGVGVVVPRRNVQDLMLRPDVVDAVARGRFDVWAVGTVEQAVEILTGVAAAGGSTESPYPPETVFGRADARLRQLADGIRAYEVPDR